MLRGVIRAMKPIAQLLKIQEEQKGKKNNYLYKH